MLLNEDGKAGVLLATVPSAGGRLRLAVAQEGLSRLSRVRTHHPRAEAGEAMAWLGA